MLELPELELYRALLAERCAGLRITAFTIKNKAFKPLKSKEQELVDTSIWFVERRYGLIVFHLDNGKRLTVAFNEHGYPYFCTAEETRGIKGDLIISFGDKNLFLVGVESDGIGLLSVKQLEESLRGQALDPLDKRFTLTKWNESLSKKRGYVKSALTDAKLLPGIGPVYSDEIAFAAGIAPNAKVPELSREQREALYKAIAETIRQSISSGGVKNQPLFPGDELSGGFGERLQVYGREGELCSRCGGTIAKVTVATRKAYCCPQCQTVN
ncbi:DNA-formamidopyrimidine glycosylase family protein [Paenibacillus sp. CAU 1782]